MELVPDENAGDLKGGFNNNLIVHDTKTGKRYLLREPHNDNPSLLEKIEDEFQRYGGWIDKGNSVRKRSSEEQLATVSKATRNDLRVVDAISAGEDRIIVPFIENAKTIDEFLPHASPEEAHAIVHTLCVDLHRAHTEQSIVYGDRWSKNILIVPGSQRQPIHVDFDLQYEGPGAMDMDVGRMTFYLLHGGGKNVIPALVTALIAHGWHNLDSVESIVRGQAEYFEGTPFGNMGEIVDLLFRTLRRSIESRYKEMPEAAGHILSANGQPLSQLLYKECVEFQQYIRYLLQQDSL